MKALKQNLKIPFFLELKTFLLSGPSPGLKDCEGYPESRACFPKRNILDHGLFKASFPVLVVQI